MPHATFRRELSRFQREHPLFRGIHPYWRAQFRGRLPVADLRRWAIDVYPIIRDFSQLYLHVAARCTDERTLTFLASTIYEETGSGVAKDSHPTLFRQFMTAIGIADDDIVDVPATPAGREFFKFAWSVARDGSFVEGLTLVGIGIERPLPALFQMISRAFRRHLGLGDEAVRYFTVHTVADVKHSQLAARIIGERATTPAAQAEVRGVLTRLWNLQQAQLDQLLERGSGGEPPQNRRVLSPVASRGISR